MDYQPIENEDDVFAIDNDIRLSSRYDRTFVIGDVINLLKTAIANNHLRQEHREQWFSTGVPVLWLKVGGKDWIRGKLRIKVCLEFCPDQDEAHLIEAETPKE